tara:strand:+ start:3730 stop:5268 length:1539 start_codon:yes stop_codon:yes gene_type:complete
MINTTGNTVERALFSLGEDDKEINGALTENFEDTTLPTTFESTKVEQGSDGRWVESQESNDQPGKKTKDIRDDRLTKDEQDVQNYKELASVSDEELLNKVTQINAKKNEIDALIDQAVSIGCSHVQIISPGSVGIASFVTADSGRIKKYQFHDLSTRNPYVSTTEDLSQSNLGDGYESLFTINGGAEVGAYKSITYNATHQVVVNGATICPGYATSIAALVTEIETLQAGVDRDLIADTNTLKRKKTDSELFVWGQKRRETKLEEQKADNANTRQLITDLSSRLDSNPENLLVHLDANNPDSYGGTGTIWYDLRGNRNGILKSADQWNAIGYMNYTGQNTDTETLIEEVPIDTSVGITVEMILNATDLTPDHIPFYFYDVTLGLWFNNDRFGFNSGNGDMYGFTGASVIFNNKWVHCVAYFPPDWSASTYTNAKIWINGSNKNLSLLSASVVTRTLNSSQNMSIGGGVTSGTNDYYSWDGNIALTKIYNKEFTDAEVLTKYNAVKDLYLDMP